MNATKKSTHGAGMTPQRARKIIERLRTFYGTPSPDLRFGSLYQLTIAVILSAQTTDRQVNEVTPVLFSRYPGFGDLAHAEVDEVEEIIRSTGFYHNKAKNIIALARKVHGQYKGNCRQTEKSSWICRASGENRPL
jgi:endonuclease-3